MTSVDTSNSVAHVMSRRALLRTAAGGAIVLGISACGSGSSDSAVDDPSTGGATSTDTTPGGQTALAGVPVEVWRDPG